MITEARASAVLRSLRRTSGLGHPSIIHLAPSVPLTSIAVHPIGGAISRLRRLHALSPSAALGGTGRAGLVPRRSIPVRRGGLAYPMVSRTRWYQRRSHDALPF